MYRVGANAGSLPINQPRVRVNNGNQDGALNPNRTRDMVNYQPSRLQPRSTSDSARHSQLALSGSTQQQGISREQNFKQAGELYRAYSKSEQRDLVNSFGQSLMAADDQSKHIILSFLYKADADYGTRVAKVAGGDLKRVKMLAADLQD
jgi:catalase